MSQSGCYIRIGKEQPTRWRLAALGVLTLLSFGVPIFRPTAFSSPGEIGNRHREIARAEGNAISNPPAHTCLSSGFCFGVRRVLQRRSSSIAARVGRILDRQKAKKPAAMRILWFGNSFSYFPVELGGIPGILNLLANAGGTDAYAVTRILRGGAALYDFEEEFKRFSRMCGGHGYDFVVLQDHSTVPAGCRLEPGASASDESMARCLKALRELYAPILKEMQQRDGTKVILYQTWGRDAEMHGRPEILGDFQDMSKKLADGYQMYADVLTSEGVRVNIVGVGDAYVRLRDSRMGATLWPKLCADSNAHPTTLAGLLIASTFAAKFARLEEDETRFPSRATVVTVGQQMGFSSDEMNALCDASGLTALYANPLDLSG